MKEPVIKLHPTKGLNPRMAACQRCGKEYGVALMGAVDFPEGKTVYQGLCEECDDEMKRFRRIVEEGGVYWKCEHCNRNGVLMPQADLAKAVRLNMKINPPEPCGVQFTRDNCPACSNGKEPRDEQEATPQ
jgi:ribosomal protein L37AE/L43A